ncbi:D-galactonate dehydratase family protein [Brooklawnia cerclae]|uniref:Mannonate dehydratase n=1 Tax=Brooklawnia cerclae TaxID=349934 RepID=A0ABX0SG78_9ACTN|nr:D-mannonate dehydratase ManD [Brooklawnia cerclae]NIH55731.1 mannonate dehydratase [Brooklawnia cerclae]
MHDRIERVDVIVASPGRNFVTLKITTADGIVGLGDATVNGRELAVASYLRDHVAPLLVGRDPGRIEDTWQELYRGVYWRRGPITMACIGAVDMALWDVLGKRTGRPVYELLGGRVRDRVDVYRHCFGWELPQLLESCDREIAQGVRFVRVQSSVPGLDKVYGISKDPNYEPAQRGALPDQETWDSAAYVHHLPGVVEAVREHVGWGIGLLHDSHHRLTPTEAGQLGHALEPYGLYWLEDVTPAEDQDALRVVREHTRVPLAIGEVFNTVWDCQKLIEDRLIDYVRCAIVHAGGISHVRKIYALGELHGVKGAPHGPSDVSPIALAASIHLATATYNFGLQEYMGYPDIVHEAFPHAWSYADGALQPGEEPGLGVAIDEQLLSRPEFEYSTAYLPVARRLDGTVQDW